jgi:hypothetical protein
MIFDFGMPRQHAEASYPSPIIFVGASPGAHRKGSVGRELEIIQRSKYGTIELKILRSLLTIIQVTRT